MDIYLDTNIYGRPYDELAHDRILKEAVACWKIFVFAAAGLFRVIASELVLAEISLIKNLGKREAVENLIISTVAKTLQLDNPVVDLADEIYTKGYLKDYADSLHLSFAASCQYFITCDDGILGRASEIEGFLSKRNVRLNITDPGWFLAEGGI